MLLSNNRNSFELYNWLYQEEERVYYYSGRLTEEQIAYMRPSWVISYNYSYIIQPEIIRLMKNRIMNLHISLLPWNRGSDPNFWSFFEDTPKGITIHLLSPELDKGDILVQRELSFDENRETLKTTYKKLNDEIVSLFQKNWEKIKSHEKKGVPQNGKGSYHKKSDLLSITRGMGVDMDCNISDLKRQLRGEVRVFSNCSR